jgi:hypothetical protein
MYRLHRGKLKAVREGKRQNSLKQRQNVEASEVYDRPIAFYTKPTFTCGTRRDWPGVRSEKRVHERHGSRQKLSYVKKKSRS